MLSRQFDFDICPRCNSSFCEGYSQDDGSSKGFLM